MSHSDFGRAPYGYGDVAYYPGMPEGPGSEDRPAGHGWGAGDGAASLPLTREFEAQAPQSAAESRAPWPRAPAPFSQQHVAQAHGDQQVVGQYLADPYVDDEYLADEFAAAPPAAPAGGQPGRRRLVIVAAVVAVGAGITAVMLTGGHQAGPGSRIPAAGGAVAPSATASKTPGQAAVPAAPITKAQAQSVVAGYTTANNSANVQHSATGLATIETGSSFAIDTGLYQMQQAAGSASYPAFGPVQTTYYIPRNEPAGSPRWFVVQVANAFFSSPKRVTNTEYLLFTQATPVSPWLNSIEPYVLSGANVPRIAVGADGLATAVAATATSAAVPPGRLAALTAASLDGTDTGSAAVVGPGNLADRSAQQSWRGKLPTATVTDTHAASHDEQFALLTASGGALVFYTDAAQLAITPPAGSMLNLAVPGFYSAAQPVTRAGLRYLDQFAAYDPPASQHAGAPSIVADYSGITAKN
jgi:hypothetical protein